MTGILSPNIQTEYSKVLNNIIIFKIFSSVNVIKLIEKQNFNIKYYYNKRKD
jgi:hypothetical protein